MATTNIELNKETATLATEGTYCDKDIRVSAALQEKTIEPTIAGFEVVPDSGYVGFSKVSMGILPVAFPTVTAGTEQITVAPENYGAKAFDGVYVDPTPSQTKTVTLTVVGETVTVTPDSGKLLSSVSISQNLQAKIVTPTSSQQMIRPDTGFCGLGLVSVEAVPTEEKTVTANGEVTPSDGKFLSKVTVNVPAIVGVATAVEMDAKLVAANVGKVYRFTGTTDSTYTNGDLYEVVSE